MNTSSNFIITPPFFILYHFLGLSKIKETKYEKTEPAFEMRLQISCENSFTYVWKYMEQEHGQAQMGRASFFKNE